MSRSEDRATESTSLPSLPATVEHALSVSRADALVVIASETSGANLRWANNSLTTNGITTTRNLTVVAVVNGAEGVCADVVSRTATSLDTVTDLVRAAEQAARDASPADDANPLIEPHGVAGTPESTGWDLPPEATRISVFDGFAAALGDDLRRAATDGGPFHYGFVSHEVTTTYLGSSTGLRLRHVQPTGKVMMTGRSAAPGVATSDRVASAWVGQGTRDFTDVDAAGLVAEVERRLAWSRRRVDMPAGRYRTLLPPPAVADMAARAYTSMSALDAAQGRSVYAKPGGGTRLGERLSRTDLTLRSDPNHPGMECAPFIVADRSSNITSVFDNGMPVSPTSWIDNGVLTSLLGSRHSASVAGTEPRPFVSNLILDVPGATASLDDMIAGLDRGLLLTGLWYIRTVDPVTLLLTGLTRDGVYLVENGEVTAEVNNFRFNESPVDLLDRFTAAGATTPALGREIGNYLPRISTPPLLVDDFNMSSVSQAS